MTFERTGRSMKNLEIMAATPHLADACGCSIFVSCGSIFWPGITRRSPAITTRSSGFRPLSITRRPSSSGADLHLALLDHIVLVDHQQIAAALVAAERGVGNEQGVLVLVEGHADAHEIAGQQHPLVVGHDAAHGERAGRLD